MASNRTIAAGQAIPGFGHWHGKATLFQSLIRQMRVIGRCRQFGFAPGRRRSAPRLADGGRLDRAGGTWPRRHPRQQAGGRRRHPEGHVPAAAIVVARRPPSSTADLSAGPRRSGPKTPGARTRGIAITISRSVWSGTSAGDRLTREDHLYDFIVEIDHNAGPRIAGRGSAVFLHLARANFSPTAGCVSMTKSGMLRLLRRMGPQTKIMIG